MPVDEFDWLFDYVLQFLESDRFDAAIMDFVDEKCEVFDNDEENKFIYTTIHEEFSDHLEGLIISNLAELNVTSDLFLDAMEKGRNDRDINRLVFERLTAIDDFLTFKRMMVKRNMELQVEALRSYQNSKLGRFMNDDDLDAEDDKHRHHHHHHHSDSERDLQTAMELSRQEAANAEASSSSAAASEVENDLPLPDELRAMKEKEMEEFVELATQEMLMDEEELQEILQSSLLEMELLHRREELEQADLEAALAMSLALEEERIRLFRIEAKKGQDNDHGNSNSNSNMMSSSNEVADAKESRSSNNPLLDTPSKRSAGGMKEVAEAKSPNGTINGNVNTNPSYADPKPLKSRDIKPLPAINKMSAELEERKKQAETLLQRNAEQLVDKRKLEEQLREQVKVVAANNANNGKMTDEQLEMEKRARHMREQRDKIIAMKKAEREKKVKEEEAKLKEIQNANGQPNNMPSHVAKAFAAALNGNSSDAKGSSSSTDYVVVTDESEARRAAMRTALARRLKMDLIESEEQRIAKQQEDQFADLDRQLQQVEKLRQENRQRELILSEQLKKQQNAIARNVKLSSVKLKDEA